MGMVVVALFAANGVGPPEATIRSTLRRTRSAASSGSRSGFCSANRYSMVIFFPSIHPSLLSSCRNASKQDRATRSSAIIQETYAGDFPCLLRVGYDRNNKQNHCNHECIAPQLSSLRTSFRAICITRIEIKESVIYGERR